MKVLFAGPSLHGVAFDAGDVVLRGPARMGDLERAVGEGATVIGLVDGHYQQVGAVWHKEILLALASGVAVFGAASMGALRAAECEPFGMLPIGSIAERYCAGTLNDDADVALTNGPAELGFPPLTEPMVDVEATASALCVAGHVSADEAAAIVGAARRVFFADRTVEAIFAHPSLPRDERLQRLYLTHRVSQKTADALELLAVLKAWRPGEPRPGPAWRFANSPFWNERVTPHSSSVTPL